MKITPTYSFSSVDRLRWQQGASLLEVLIAMLIMSFGLLALGGLSAASLKYSKISQFQTIGSQLASEYGDRIRGNVEGFRNEKYNITTSYSGSSNAVSIPACATPALCLPAEIAAIDIAEWTNALKRRLPAGGAYVTQDTTDKLSADIWIMWAEPDMKFDTSDLSATETGGDQCPEASISGLNPGTPKPRCLYFRVTL